MSFSILINNTEFNKSKQLIKRSNTQIREQEVTFK